LKNLKLQANIGGTKVLSEVPLLSAMTSRKVPFRMNPASVTQKGNVTCTLTLLQDGKPIDEKTITLTALSASEHHSNTFISDIDGSVQYYAVAPQVGGNKPGSALFLSVHGAEVEAIGQARAY
jgi:hypothetical protein